MLRHFTVETHPVTGYFNLVGMIESCHTDILQQQQWQWSSQ